MGDLVEGVSAEHLRHGSLRQDRRMPGPSADDQIDLGGGMQWQRSGGIEIAEGVDRLERELVAIGAGSGDGHEKRRAGRRRAGEWGREWGRAGGRQRS